MDSSVPPGYCIKEPRSPAILFLLSKRVARLVYNPFRVVGFCGSAGNFPVVCGCLEGLGKLVTLLRLGLRGEETGDSF